ncbi:MAG TPA: DUF6186 family protein [Acidimicrobiia bacterium]|nr:DUF6186 family protein [Acidimicrobiia bacterium]
MFAVVYGRGRWPTLGALLRHAVRSRAGSAAFIALWLWMGWHFLIRGWQFFLRGHGPSTAAGKGGALSLSELLVSVVFVLAVLYALFVVFLVSGYRGWRAHPDTSSARTLVLSRTARQLALGYIVFIAAMGVYETLAGHSAHGIFGSAVRDGGFLAFAIAAPVFIAGTLAAEALARRRTASPE